MPLPRYRPMLASPIRRGLPVDGWRWEPKLDGWRALVYVDGGTVAVRTRSGRDVSAKVPELGGLLDVLDGRQVVLDGELVGGDGRPDGFYALLPALAGARRERFPVAFAAFDVLHLEGVPLLREPYVERRRRLEELGLRGPAWATVPSFDCDAGALFAVCADLGLEGVVAKRPQSRYRPGDRSADWVKVKCPAWRAQHGPLRQERVRERS